MVRNIGEYQVSFEIEDDGSVRVLSAFHRTGIQCSYGATFESYEAMVKAIEDGIWGCAR